MDEMAINNVTSDSNDSDKPDSTNDPILQSVSRSLDDIKNKLNELERKYEENINLTKMNSLNTDNINDDDDDDTFLNAIKILFGSWR